MEIDSEQAREIAVRFLEQYHSVTTASTELMGDVWLVVAKVGIAPQKVKKVQIDGQTGRIIGCE